MKKWNNSNTKFHGRGYYPAITPRTNGQITFNKALEVHLGLKEDDKIELIENIETGSVKWYLFISEGSEAFSIRRESQGKNDLHKRKQLYFQNKFLSNKLRKLSSKEKYVRLTVSEEPVYIDHMELYEIEIGNLLNPKLLEE